MLKAIVFDFDGVLVDSEPVHYRALAEATRGLGVQLSYPDYLRDYLGYDDRETLRRFLAERCRRPDLAKDEEYLANLGRAKTRRFHELAAAGVPMIAGARQLLEEARGSMPLLVASGAGRAEIELVLRGLGIEDYFRHIVSADDVARSKPDPQTYRLAYERLAGDRAYRSIRREECLAIEDSAAGVASARGAGLLVLGLASSHGGEDLSAAHRVVGSLKGVGLGQLRAWFD